MEKKQKLLQLEQQKLDKGPMKNSSEEPANALEMISGNISEEPADDNYEGN